MGVDMQSAAVARKLDIIAATMAGEIRLQSCKESWRSRMSVHLRAWLENIGLGKYADKFAENDIDFQVLPDLSDQDLVDLGVSLGHRRLLLKKAAALPAVDSDGSSSQPTAVIQKGETRQLTVMFCDLVGSTELSTRVDPQELGEIVAEYRACCEKAVTQFGGTIAQFMGDGVLVYFGYPMADEHDPERAIRAGHEVIRSVRELKVEHDFEPHTRVGIATGQVVVGGGVSNSVIAQEQTAFGQTPNLAARLQGLAESDEVVISEVTRRLVGGLFEYIDLGVHSLKGFDVPVVAWRVGREVTVESRFAATHSTTDIMPMVGRQKEIDWFLEQWELVKAAKGRAIFLVGEAGIGKSRLTHELQSLMGEQQSSLLRFYCAPHQLSSALFPMISYLERAAGLTDSDSPAARLDKLEALLVGMGGNVAEIAPLFCELLSIPDEGRYTLLNLSPQRQKERTLAAFEALIRSAAQHGHPALVIFEDLHWVDPTTLELLQRLVDRVQSLPILLLLTSRPEEFDLQRFDADFITTIELKRLNTDQVENLATGLAGQSGIPPDVLRQIVEKTDGVPLFVEELTKTALDAHSAGDLQELVLPCTLRQSLSARIDDLGSAKPLLQLCSLLGDSIDYRLLQAVSPTQHDESLQAGLGFIVASEILSQNGVPPDSTYTFRHVLLQEQAYHSLAPVSRATLHRQIAEILERDFPDTVSRRPHELARHHEMAGRTDVAVNYWLTACRKSIDSFANLEAISQAERGLGLLGDLPHTAKTDAIRIALSSSLGKALMATRGYADPGVRSNFGTALELCEKLGDSPQMFEVLVGLWMYYVISGQFDAGNDIAQRLLRIAEASEQNTQLVQALYCLGFTQYYRGDFSASERHLRRALAAEKPDLDYAVHSPSGDDTRVHVRCALAHVLWHLGRPKSSQKFAVDALEMAAGPNHPYGAAYAAFAVGWLHMNRNEIEPVIELASRTIQISEERGYKFWIPLAQFILSWAVGCQCSDDSSSGGPGAMAGWLETYQGIGAGAGQTFMCILTAEECMKRGRYDDATQWLERATKLVASTNERFYEPEILRLQARLLLDGPDGRTDEDKANQDKAAELLHEALESANASGGVTHALRAAIDLAGLLTARGNTGEAHRILIRAYEALPETDDIEDWKRAGELINKFK